LHGFAPQLPGFGLKSWKTGAKMTNAIKSFMLYLVRFLVMWVVNALSLLATAWLMPGVTLTAVGDTPRALVAVSAALLLAIVNLLIRPVILLIAKPLGWIALFVVGFLTNALAIWITAWLLPGFDVSILGSIVRRHRLRLLQRHPHRHPGTGRRRLVLPEPHRTPRQGAALRQRGRTGARADDGGDRRAELLAPAARRWTMVCCPRCKR
jgi:putative membrane protein